MSGETPSSLLELLRRRRACRSFRDDAVPGAALEGLAQAAQYAATASNVPYREVLIVDDPAVVRSIRSISAALLADAPALLIILSDQRLAVERVGRVGGLSSAIDSGAAGENVWLAATELGLGTQFTMISAMAGIRVILGLPEHLRVDLIMPVGYAAEEPRAASPRRTVPPLHRNRYRSP